MPPVILKENMDTWVLFTHVASCWKYAGMEGVLVGLDYSSVYRIAESICIDITPRIIAGLQAIEREAIKKSTENSRNQGREATRKKSRKKRGR